MNLNLSAAQVLAILLITSPPFSRAQAQSIADLPPASGSESAEAKQGAPGKAGKKSNRPNELANAYAFCKSQDALVARFLAEMPDHSASLSEANAAFQETFGTARRRLEAKIRSLFGDQFEAFEKTVASKVDASVKGKLIDKPGLDAFTTDLKKRSKGEMKPGIRAVLLTFQFITKPQREFQGGYTFAAGVPDSKMSHGINFTIRVPLSWRALPVPANNALGEFRSESGWGSESLLLLLGQQVAPPEKTLGMDEFEAALSREQLLKFMPKSGKILDLRPVRINGVHGVIMIGEQTVERGGKKRSQRLAVFATLVNNRQLFVECLITAPFGAEKALAAHYQRYEKLFQHMVNSFQLKPVEGGEVKE